MKTIKKVLPRAVLLVAIFTILCGIVYTGIVTGIGQLFFKDKANGSIIEIDGVKYGSELLGQQYTGDAHMWGRIMNLDTATYTDKNGSAVMYATSSNLSPASKEYGELVKERVKKLKEAHPEKGDQAIPVDLVTCSGSGLDPDISLAAAKYQIERIARNNHMDIREVEEIVDRCTTHKVLGVFGEETVNVLKVNLMLEGIL